MKLIFDIETNGFLNELNKIFCLEIYNIDEDKTYSYSEKNMYEGIELLSKAELLVGHNILGFDIPAINKCYPNIKLTDNTFDTLVATRLMWADVKQDDFKTRNIPTALIGRHSLSAWGYRIGVLKGDFGETSDWSKWSEEMQSYCKQDVEVTRVLYEKILAKKYSETSLKLEHDFAKCIIKQEQLGFVFDTDKAKELYKFLNVRRIELQQQLQEVFPPFKKVVGILIPKRDNKTKGYIKGQPVEKIKEIVFNAGSRDHIADRLKTIKGWKPKEFTNDGKAKVDEKVLSSLEYPEAKLLSEYLLIQKRLGMLAEGDNAWLKLEKNGKIYGKVITNGTVTGRCTHFSPNVAQVCSTTAKYGKECRELFTVPKGYLLVGADASGLELRCLASYMAKFDNGAYGKELVQGDIHTANQKASGLPTRNDAKKFIYSFLYGAGDKRIGEIVNGSSREGKILKQTFLKRTPALQQLRDRVGKTFRLRGFLKGLDGRELQIRSEHSALNTLLQSCGSIIVKKATILLHENLSHLKHGEDWGMVAHIHDEIQLQVKEELAEEVGKIAVQSIQQVKDYFNFHCELDGEYKIGNSWAETH